MRRVVRNRAAFGRHEARHSHAVGLIDVGVEGRHALCAAHLHRRTATGFERLGVEQPRQGMSRRLRHHRRALRAGLADAEVLRHRQPALDVLRSAQAACSNAQQR
jgi:hypothetical protein